jgi:hypothetical protein
VERTSLAGETAVITERDRVARRRFAKSKDDKDASGMASVSSTRGAF